QWSNPSKNTINNFVGGSGASCLDDCIPPPPVADFTSSGTGGCLPVTIDFYDGSEGQVSSRLWSFPGGEPSSSTLQNPTVTYYEKGSYDVSLTVTNAGGSDEKIMTDYVEINDIPVTFF
ncbi:PKD domain-containing protein, partial [Arthrospira platensis SPKY1]|nr:PKD domain-containing protein [Arthrospira platensis SPKY1]